MSTSPKDVRQWLRGRALYPTAQGIEAARGERADIERLLAEHAGRLLPGDLFALFVVASILEDDARMTHEAVIAEACEIMGAEAGD